MIYIGMMRLMQIGRVDRRMDPKVEAKLIEDHPNLKSDRGKVTFEFLPLMN